MKILAIMGSPKGKGSGYRIARDIEDALRCREPVDFEYLFLKDAQLEMCKGCFQCVVRGEDRCPLRDDREAIEEKIEAADGVVLVSPCYVSNVSWLMKNFIDRLCYTNHRPRFFRQKLFLVSNAGAGMEDTIKALRYALGAGPRIAAEMTFLSPPWPLAPKVVRKQQRLLRRKTEAFYRAVKRDEVRGGLPAVPGFGEYLRFRFFKKISADTKEYLRADHAYYREAGEYYYPARVSILKKAAASCALALSMLLMRDMAPAGEPSR